MRDSYVVQHFLSTVQDPMWQTVVAALVGLLVGFILVMGLINRWVNK